MTVLCPSCYETHQRSDIDTGACPDCGHTPVGTFAQAIQTIDTLEGTGAS